MSFQRYQYYPRVSLRTSLSRTTYSLRSAWKNIYSTAMERRSLILATDAQCFRGRVCAHQRSDPFWVSPPTRSLNPLEAASEHDLGSPRVMLGIRYNVERTFRHRVWFRGAFFCEQTARLISWKRMYSRARAYISLACR